MTNLERIQVFSQQKYKKIVTQIFFAHSSYFLFFLLALVFTSQWLLWLTCGTVVVEQKDRPAGTPAVFLLLLCAVGLLKADIEVFSAVKIVFR